MKRILPPDFLEMRAKLKSRRELCAHYDCGESLISRWMRECGLTVSPNKGTPAPDNLAELADKMHLQALADHCGVSRNVAANWLHTRGVKALPFNQLANVKTRPVPPNFTKIAPTMVEAELRKHCGCSFETLKRWLRETGVKPMSYVEWRALNPVKKPVKPRKSSRGAVHALGLPSNLAMARVSTVHDIAADTLRRERFVVHRCNENGKYAQAGNFFRVGWSVLTPDQLLAKAARYERKAA